MTISEAKKLLISEKHYVLFRLPNEKAARLVAANHIHAYDTLPSDWSQLRNSFVFAPFSTERERFLAIPSEKSHLIEIERKPQEPKESLPTESTPSGEYTQAFEAFSAAIRRQKFQKLVLSRSCDIAIPTQNPVDLFEKAALAYPNAMVYLFHTPLTGHWLGVSPELLIAGDDIQLRTIALAGTQRNNGGTIPLENWGEKERLEQRIVADYIRDRIAGFGTCKDEWGPYSINAGHLSHLRTDFYFQVDESRRADFISAIHPTPAVCGLPKEESIAFIQQHEGYDRSYYAGFLGMVEDSSQMELYVNLRCMRFDEKSATLYAGGGILSTSDLASEWIETEEKMNTLKRILF